MIEKRIEIFLCYAREDEALRLGLKKQLSPLMRQGLIDVWYDRLINPGADWEHEINSHLGSAQIILLLVSPDFMDSDYCYGVEMTRAMERHKRGEARVIPVILRPTAWHDAPFGRLQALPPHAVPVVSREWYSQDEAFFAIVKGLTKVIKDFRASQDRPHMPSPAQSSAPPVPPAPQASAVAPPNPITPRTFSQQALPLTGAPAPARSFVEPAKHARPSRSPRSSVGYSIWCLSFLLLGLFVCSLSIHVTIIGVLILLIISYIASLFLVRKWLSWSMAGSVGYGLLGFFLLYGTLHIAIVGEPVLDGIPLITAVLSMSVSALLWQGCNSIIANWNT